MENVVQQGREESKSKDVEGGVEMRDLNVVMNVLARDVDVEERRGDDGNHKTIRPASPIKDRETKAERYFI
jgi:hypothetical protein